MYINVAVQYIRPKQSFYIRESLRRLILEVVEADELDLEVDPSIVRLYQSTLSRPHLIAQPLQDIPHPDLRRRDANWGP